jgi:hypothetical protein
VLCASLFTTVQIKELEAKLADAYNQISEVPRRNQERPHFPQLTFSRS